MILFQKSLCAFPGFCFFWCSSKIKQNYIKLHETNLMHLKKKGSLSLNLKFPCWKVFQDGFFSFFFLVVRDILTVWSEIDKIHQRLSVKCWMLNKARHRDLVLYSLNTQRCE